MNRMPETEILPACANYGLGALEHRFSAEDEALVDSLVKSGHPSTPGYNDPRYRIGGRPTHV